MSKPKKKPLRYFFFGGDLHKKIHINRGADIITAWNYPKGKAVKLSYTDVKRNGEKAFTSIQVQQMIGRKRKAIEDAIKNGMIPAPQKSYSIDSNRNPFAYFWCEKDIMGLHAYLSTVHRGRPRKDGMVTPAKLPTVAELRAMIRQGTVFYVKDSDGNFIPTWDAEKF